jgi:prevent-host-death family protein
VLWSVAEAKAKFSEVIKGVLDGEPAVITKNGQPVACIIPPPMRNVYQARLFQLKEWLGNPSISRIAEALELPRAGDLGRFFDAEDEPSFEFLDGLSRRFHSRPEWLKHGESENSPWERVSCDFTSAERTLQNLKALAPKEIFFVRIDHQDRKPEDDWGEAGLILKWDPLTYQAFGTQVHVSSHVGGTGRMQLWEYCQLTRLIPECRQWSVSGKVLPMSLFKDIFGGRKWAGLAERASYSTWWDDLADFNFRYPIAGEDGEGYARHYGESFRDAQSVLRYYAKELAQQKTQTQQA